MKPVPRLVAWSLPFVIVAVLFVGEPLGAGDAPKEEKAPGEVRRFSHQGHIYLVAFSPDGKLVATDEEVWEVATGKKVSELPLPPRDRRQSSHYMLAFSPDSKHVAVHRYSDIVLAEAATGKEVWRVELAPHDAMVRPSKPRLAFTPDGKHLLSARNDEALVRVWTVARGKEVRSFRFDPKEAVSSVYSFGISSDGQKVVVHDKEVGQGETVVLDFETGKELSRHQLGGEGWAFYSAPVPDGKHFVYAETNTVHLMDLKTGKDVRTFEGVGKYTIVVACSPDGKYVAATVRADDHGDDWVECWEASTGKSVRVFKGHTRHITSLAFSPDGNHILSGGEDGTARLWRLKD
jgi:WD40 repeat protein